MTQPSSTPRFPYAYATGSAIQAATANFVAGRAVHIVGSYAQSVDADCSSGKVVAEMEAAAAEKKGTGAGRPKKGTKKNQGKKVSADKEKSRVKAQRAKSSGTNRTYLAIVERLTSILTGGRTGRVKYRPRPAAWHSVERGESDFTMNSIPE